jgi:hypothetical protein
MSRATGVKKKEGKKEIMFPSARLVFKVVGAELTGARQLALALLLGSLAVCHALRRERKAA